MLLGRPPCFTEVHVCAIEKFPDLRIDTMDVTQTFSAF
jgi:hypothetical protein